MNQQKFRRLGGMTSIAGFALIVLAACGGGNGEVVEEDVTRVATTSAPAAEATTAATASSPAAEEIAASPAAEEAASPAAERAAASPAATTEEAASPVAAAATPEESAAAPAAASPVAAAATPMAEATPMGEATPAAAEDAAASPAAEEAAAPAADSVAVVSHDIFFDPDEFGIPAESEVTVSLPNEGVTLHNFSITEKNNPDVPNLGIDVDIAPGATEETVVNAPTGDYYYFCNVPGHEAAGMFGTMHVE